MSYPVEKYNIYTDNAGRIYAVSTYAGKPVRASAKCHPNDAYDFEYGKKIAIARCALKIAEKRRNRALCKMYEAQMAFDEIALRLDKMADYFDDAQDALDLAEDELDALLMGDENA